MYKVQNAYKESSIMSLNLMEISDNRKIGLSAAELAVLLLLLAALTFIIAWPLIPDMEFMAMCHNIVDGDICKISIK